MGSEVVIVIGKLDGESCASITIWDIDVDVAMRVRDFVIEVIRSDRDILSGHSAQIFARDLEFDVV